MTQKTPALGPQNSGTFLQMLIDDLPIGIFVASARDETRGRLVLWNDALSAMTTRAATQAIGRTVRDVFEQSLIEPYEANERAMLGDPVVMTISEGHFHGPDGQTCIMHLTMVPMHDEQKRMAHILGVFTDVTEQKRAQREFAEQRAELEAVQDASPLGQFRTDAKGSTTYINETVERLIGHSRTSQFRSEFGGSTHEEDRERVVAAWHSAIASHNAFNETYRLVRADGHVIWVSVKTAPVRIAGEVSAFVGTVDDITHAKEAEFALRESEAILRTITDALPMHVAYVDTEERYRFNNLAYETYYGVPREKIYGMTMRELLGDDLYSCNSGYLRAALKGEMAIYEMEQGSGPERRNFRITMIPHRKHNEGAVLGVHLIAQDITAQKFEQQRLAQMAERDALTTLLNRAGFEIRLADAIRNDSAGMRVALMYLDIDRFKEINDTYGHSVGDAFLKAFAGRLTRCVRASDSVARIGGDEFTIILERLAHPEDAAQVAAKILKVIREPFNLDGVILYATTSIGIAFHERIEDAISNSTIEAQTLIKDADAMLYQAKAAGRNSYRMAEFRGT